MCANRLWRFCLRRCLHLGDPNHRAGKRNKRVEGRYGFLTSQCDPAEALDTIEETFDKVAFLIERPVDLLGVLACRVLFDLRHRAKIICNKLTQIISVISRIRHDMPDACQPFDQTACLWTIAPLAGGDHKSNGQAERVNSGVYFRGQPAF